MGEKLLALLKGMASTMDLAPPESPSIGVTDRAERLRRPWVRTGQAIQRAIDTYDREKASQ